MKPKKINELKLTLPALSANEAVSRAIIGAFIAQLDPTIEEVADLKCAVSEAVTNCIVHGYRGEMGPIYISVTLFEDRSLTVVIRDRGCGIPDVKLARQPLYTTNTDGERSGMGFSVMETFTDRLFVSSRVDKGTRVSMKKCLS